MIRLGTREDGGEGMLSDKCSPVQSQIWHRQSLLMPGSLDQLCLLANPPCQPLPSVPHVLSTQRNITLLWLASPAFCPRWVWPLGCLIILCAF